MNKIMRGITCALVLALSACGGSSGSKSTSSSVSTVSSSSVASSSVASSDHSASESSAGNSSSAANLQSGVFIDSAVAGIRYTTAPSNQSGFTTLNGEYQFVEGDTVAFSIGDLVFPTVTAKGVVTPVDMAESADPQNQLVINIAALLQSLDTDGNPANGITINYEVAATSAQAVEFDLPYAQFSAQSAVTNLVANAGSVNTALVSAEAASAHLQKSLTDIKAAALVGTWYVEGDGYQYVLAILDDSIYATIDYDSSASAGVFEYGTYSWNQATGAITVQSEQTTADGELDAMPPFANGNIMVLDGNTLSLTDADETFTLTRLAPSATHPLMGGWSFIEEDESLVVFAFTATHYLMGEFATADEAGQAGIEVGTYGYDVETHALTVATLFETNGQWGLSHPCAVLDKQALNDLSCGPEGRDIVQTITIDGSVATFISEADTIANGKEEPVQLYRIEDVIDGSIRLRLALTLEVTAYQPGERYEIFESENVIASMQCYQDEDIQVGDTESWNETWYLRQQPGALSQIGELTAEYNPVTGEIKSNITTDWEPVTCATGDCSAFSDRVTDKLDLVFHPGETPVITGTYVEDRELRWTYDTRISRCITTYTITGVLR